MTIKGKHALRDIRRAATLGVKAHSEPINVNVVSSLKSGQRTCTGDLAPYVIQDLEGISRSDKASQAERYRRLVK